MLVMRIVMIRSEEEHEDLCDEADEEEGRRGEDQG